MLMLLPMDAVSVRELGPFPSRGGLFRLFLRPGEMVVRSDVVKGAADRDCGFLGVQVKNSRRGKHTGVGSGARAEKGLRNSSTGLGYPYMSTAPTFARSLTPCARLSCMHGFGG